MNFPKNGPKQYSADSRPRFVGSSSSDDAFSAKRVDYSGSMAGTELVTVPRLPKRWSIYKDTTPAGEDRVQLLHAVAYFSQQLTSHSGQGATGLQDYLTHMAGLRDVFTPDTLSRLAAFAKDAEAAAYRPTETEIVLAKVLDYLSTLRVKQVQAGNDGMIRAVGAGGFVAEKK